MSDKKTDAAATPTTEAAVGTVSKNSNQAAITLDTPLKRGDQTIDKILLRKPQSGELRGLKLTDVMQMDVSAMTVLLPRITSPTLTPQDVAALDPADLLSLSSEVSGFFLSKADRASLQL